jgi:lipopolysaccharide transport system permease protein
MKQIIIEPGKIEIQYWIDLWRYRELLFFLTWRDILVRYKQTIVGIGWALIRPVLTLLVLSIIFGSVAKLPSNGIPYPVLVLCGMLPWNFFATAFSDCGSSLISNSSMISKVYFPRLIIPISSVMTSLIDFLISGSLMIFVLIYYNQTLDAKIIFLPLFIIQAFIFAFAAGLWVSALMVKFRDFKYIVPFVVQFGLYLSPVGFSSSVIPNEWRLLYSLNPVVGIIDGFRWCILKNSNFYVPGALLSSVSVLILVITGIKYFRKTERTFADII